MEILTEVTREMRKFENEALLSLLTKLIIIRKKIFVILKLIIKINYNLFLRSTFTSLSEIILNFVEIASV